MFANETQRLSTYLSLSDEMLVMHLSTELLKVVKNINGSWKKDKNHQDLVTHYQEFYGSQVGSLCERTMKQAFDLKGDILLNLSQMIS
jgi:hypothetical protein